MADIYVCRQHGLSEPCDLCATNPTPAQQVTLEPLTDRELQQMEQWAGAGIADPQPYSDLMKLAVKTDAFLQRALQEVRRTRRAAVAGPQGVIELLSASLLHPESAEGYVRQAIEMLSAATTASPAPAESDEANQTRN